jgi:hypothetical protein
LRIHHYATCWNEARVLQFFFRHYQPFISRFFVYDDGSTDGSLDILAAEPDVVVRRRRRSHPDSFVLSGRDHTNNCWKESRGLADWVIIGNIDEHLHHPSLREYLEHCRDKGITVVPALGYQMLSDSFPPAHVKLCGAITRGAPWRQMNKLILFNPDAVREINFDVGRHAARPETSATPSATNCCCCTTNISGATTPARATPSCAPACARWMSPTAGVTNIGGARPNSKRIGGRWKRARSTSPIPSWRRGTATASRAGGARDPTSILRPGGSPMASGALHWGAVRASLAPHSVPAFRPCIPTLRGNPDDHPPARRDRPEPR